MNKATFRIPIVVGAVPAMVALIGFGLVATSQIGAQEVIYAQNFDDFPNDTVDLGDGSVMAGTARVVDGELLLTEDLRVSLGAFWIPPSAVSADGWVAEFDYRISSFSGNQPADGFSFNYGLVPPGETTDQAEEGFNVQPNISFEMDTWLNGTEEVGPAIAVDGIDLLGGFINGDMLSTDSMIEGSIQIVLEADGTTSFTSTGALTDAFFFDLASGFTPHASYAFAFAARTGGASQEMRIDNLRIISIFVPDPATKIEPISSVEFTKAMHLQLTIPTAVRRLIGVEYSPELSPGSWIELGNFSEDADDATISRFIDPDSIRLGRSSGYYRAFLRPFVDED